MAFVLTTSSVWSGSFEDHLVYIKGSSLTARNVLDLVEDQVDVRLVLKAKDHLAYRKDYDDLVTVAQVFDALKAYYLDHMGVELEMRSFGRHRYVIYSKNVIPSHESEEGLSDGDELDQPAFEPPQIATSDLVFDDASFSAPVVHLESTSAPKLLVDSMEVIEPEPVDMEMPRPENNFLNVEVIGRQVVSSSTRSVDEPKPKSTSTEERSRTFELEDLVVAEEKFVAKGDHLSWSERLQNLFGSDGMASSDDGVLRSPVMVGMMRYRNVFSPVKSGLSLGFESTSLAQGSDVDVSIAETVVAYQHRTKDDFDLRLGLSAGYEKSDVKMGQTKYRSRVYGLSALDFSMSKDVYASSDFTGRMAMKFKVPLMIGSKGLMGGTGLDIGLSTGLGYDALDAFWSLQFDLTHYSDHDRLGATQSLVPSFSLSCEREFSKFSSWSFGGVWGESPFQSSGPAWLSEGQLMFYVGVRSLSAQLPLTAHLYVGASESSPDMGLTITWFPNIKTSL